MRVLVTGAGGFIGSHVAGVLAEAGHCVCALERPGGSSGRLADCLSGIRLVRVDLCDTNSVDRILQEIKPECAHGFQTLVSDSEVFYQISEFHHPECTWGVRRDDPVYRIDWPRVEHRIPSEKNLSYGGYGL